MEKYKFRKLFLNILSDSTKLFALIATLAAILSTYAAFLAYNSAKSSEVRYLQNELRINLARLFQKQYNSERMISILENYKKCITSIVDKDLFIDTYLNQSEANFGSKAFDRIRNTIDIDELHDLNSYYLSIEASYEASVTRWISSTETLLFEALNHAELKTNSSNLELFGDLLGCNMLHEKYGFILLD